MSRSDFKQFDEIDLAFRNSKGKVKQAPELPAGVRIADTHCHLNMLDKPGLAIARAAAQGVSFLCCITDPAEQPHSADEDSTFLSAADTYATVPAWLDEAQELLQRFAADSSVAGRAFEHVECLPEQPTAATPGGPGPAPTEAPSSEQSAVRTENCRAGAPELPRIRLACGVHPHNAKHWDSARDELLALLDDPLTCCLGEIGLDYHYDFSPRDAQREVFAEQLRIAHERNLPVSLHLREAHDEALEILEREGVPSAGCILHCFNLDTATLQPFLDLGCHVAFGGPLTFRKSWYTRLACLDVPFDKLLTETDAPYMAPEPLRGTVCEPAQTVYTLRMLLDCHGYAGTDRAFELVQPRAIDIENGEEAPSMDELPDFEAMRLALGEAEFANLVYDNAIALLDR